MRPPMNPSDLLAQLNETQAAAAAHFEGPALIVAGAGSGKTRTLIYRIAHLISAYDVLPSEILAVTFTNKAAAEMKERAAHLMPHANDLWLSTFHSAGVRILRIYGEYIGIGKNFVIYDDNDQLDIIKKAMSHVSGIGEEFLPKFVRPIIDRAKNNMQRPEDLLSSPDPYIGGLPKNLAAEVYMRYEKIKKEQNAIDFNDLIIETVRLFKQYPEILEQVQRRAQFIQVDEYQDTNKAQYELTRLLSQGKNNLLVVGDPDQSIYAFRGADIQNILDFQSDYRGAKTYILEHNYRSNAHVLEAANKLIENNQARLEKTLRAVKEHGHPIMLHRAETGIEEGDFVANWLTKMHIEGHGWQDMAVLYRTNAQSRQIEDSLRHAGIPAKIVGGISFYDRREVKDILAYTRLALNPASDVSLRRIISQPKRGIGESSLQKLEGWAGEHNVPILIAAERAGEILSGNTAKKVTDFAELMRSLSEAQTLPAGEFLRLVIDATGYRSMLVNEGKDGEPRLENLEELINAADEWNETQGGTIAEFLDDVSLLGSLDKTEETEEHKVTLMTMHNAKGLEFPVVFIVGIEEGLLPSNGSIKDGDKGVEEERRLFYVAITRAMERLFLTSANKRMRYGTITDTEESRFIEEIEGYYENISPSRKERIFLQQPWKSHQSSSSHQKWSRPERSIERPIEKSTIPTPKDTAQGEIIFKGGEKVEHVKFGKGQVLAVAGTGKDQILTVYFDKVGNKKLMARLAQLTLI